MLSNAFLRSISEVAQLSVLIPLLLIPFRFAHFDRVFRLLSVLILTATAIAYIAYQYYSEGKNNMPLSHLYTLLEYLLWSLIYYQLFQASKARHLILGLMAVFAIFVFINALCWQSIYSYNSYSRSVEGLLLICFALGWFYKVFTESHIQRLEQHPFFWVNTAVLVYFSGAFLLFIFSLFIYTMNKRNALEAWALHGIFLIFHYLFIAIGIWKKANHQPY